MRLAIFQMAARAGNVPANLAAIEGAARQAAGGGADILLAPELAITGYGAGEALGRLAEPLDGPTIGRLAAVAAGHGLALVTGFAERAGEAVYNSAVLLRPEGGRAIYRKCQLYGDYEKHLFAPGPTAPDIIDLGNLKVGLLVCFDVEFPEYVRRLAARGAELILVPTALPASEHAAFIATRIVPVRAFENQVFVAYANHVGRDEAFAYAGLSCICAPDGSDLARAGADGETVLFADIAPDRFEQCRLDNPYLAERRFLFT
jgi:5-aminopentanamidase